MNTTVETLIISSLVTAVGSALTYFLTKWIERQHNRLINEDETSTELRLKRFDQGETIRQELQTKVDRLEKTVNRHERAFNALRNSINDILRESLLTMHLAAHDIRTGHPNHALKRLEDGIEKIQAVKLPDLPEE